MNHKTVRLLRWVSVFILIAAQFGCFGYRKSNLNSVLQKHANPQDPINSKFDISLYFIPNSGKSEADAKAYTIFGKHKHYFTRAAIYTGSARLSSSETSWVELSPVNARKDAQVLFQDLHTGRINYILGSEKNHKANIRTYGSLIYESVYDGIDLKFYNGGGDLKYDVLVHPGADASQILFRYTDTKKLKISEEGNLVIELPGGSIVHKKPLIFQKNGDSIRWVPGGFRIDRSIQAFGFEIPHYNKDELLIIDPNIDYSTYLGGGNDDSAGNVDVDDFGNTYIVGRTTSSDFPATPGAFDEECGTDGTCDTSGEPLSDIFVAKLNPEGSALIYATYIGGSDIDEPGDISVSSNGNVFITGETFSADFPTTPGTFDRLCGIDGSCNDDSDSFVTVLSADGSALIYSTYLGGEGQDTGFAIKTNDISEAYVAGLTSSSDFPVTPGVLDTSCGCSGNVIVDAFLAQFSADGSTLIFSTFLGGSGNDQIRSIEIDNTGSVYASGFTNSNDFPVLNALQTENAGADDAFIVKISPSGTNLLFSTYLGGTLDDNAYGIALGPTGNIYVTGSTWSVNFPVFNPFQANNQGYRDGFVTAINNDGSAFIFSSYLGGSNSDDLNDISVDEVGALYVVGGSFSSDFPLQNQFQEFNSTGNLDGIVTKFTPDGQSLAYSSYIGGADGDSVVSSSYRNRTIYICGATASGDFPTSPNAYDITCGNDSNCDGPIIGDAFVTRICDNILGVDDIQVTEGNAGNSMATFHVSMCHPLGIDVTVDYQTQDGTAVSGDDYVATSGTLLIPKGDVSATFDVPVIGDALAEPNEDFFVNLSNATGTTITDSQGRATILTDDDYFFDDFSDGVLSWTTRGQWTENGGYMICDSRGKALAPIPWPTSGSLGCTTCTIETSLRLSTGSASKVIISAWVLDNRNRVDLILKEENDKVVIKQKSSAMIVAKKSVSYPILPNTDYLINISYNNGLFNVSVNNSFLMSINAGVIPYGNVGYKVKNVSAQFDYIRVY